MATLAGTDARGDLTVAPSHERPRLVGDLLLATILFIAAEMMLFAALISAFAIVKSSASIGLWPPPGQPRLPIQAAAFNMSALLVSGFMMFSAWRAHKTIGPDVAKSRLVGAFGLGALFVGLQSYEWVQLVGQGLTLTSSQLGSFFYLIAGCHALHAFGGLVALFLALRRLHRGRMTDDVFAATALFWYFVVLLWPILYWQVYL